MTDEIRELLDEELPDEIPPDIREEAIEAVTGKSTLGIDEGIEVIVRKVPQSDFSESHVHGAGNDLMLHLTPEDARKFDRDILNPMMASIIIDQEVAFDEYQTHDLDL
jgi:hypothetical protein